MALDPWEKSQGSKLKNNNNKNEKIAKKPCEKKKQDQKSVVDPIIPPIIRSPVSFSMMLPNPQDENPMVEDVSETAGNREKFERGRNRPT
ncbi:hypothetical protein TNCV_4099991 [Trichonephila clavipes]|nr:hypothetical protein TNCV_4099991 [Trichonephila clavipes]